MNVPVQGALAAVRDARALSAELRAGSSSQAPILVSANLRSDATTTGDARQDDCPCHCAFPCAVFHSPLVPTHFHDLLPRMTASPWMLELPVAVPGILTMEPAVRPPIA